MRTSLILAMDILVTISLLCPNRLLAHMGTTTVREIGRLRLRYMLIMESIKNLHLKMQVASSGHIGMVTPLLGTCNSILTGYSWSCRSSPVWLWNSRKTTIPWVRKFSASITWNDIKKPKAPKSSTPISSKWTSAMPRNFTVPSPNLLVT